MAILQFISKVITLVLAPCDRLLKTPLNENKYVVMTKEELSNKSNISVIRV